VLWIVLSLEMMKAASLDLELIASMNMFQVSLGLLLLSVSAATSLAEERTLVATRTTFDRCLGRVSETTGHPIADPRKKLSTSVGADVDEWLAETSAEISQLPHH